jgi:hypothetical protein
VISEFQGKQEDVQAGFDRSGISSQRMRGTEDALIERKEMLTLDKRNRTA